MISFQNGCVCVFIHSIPFTCLQPSLVEAVTLSAIANIFGRSPARDANQETISIASTDEAPLSIRSDSPEAEGTVPDAQISNACDDSDDAFEQPPWSTTQHTLLTDNLGPRDLAELHFSVVGVLVDLSILRGRGAKRHVPISRAVAIHLTGGILPSDERVLQHGRLAPVQMPGYKLTLPLDEHARQGAGRWLACGNIFFNFVLQQWQPMSRLVAYLPGRHVLYCAFRPAEDALFVKLGYRALGDSKRESIVRYVEKKTRHLRMTNVPGAGLFLMPLPESHHCFDAPARAAEESLKSAVRSSRHLQVSPSGHNCELVSFSNSLEYYFVKSKGEGTVLEALAHTLQDFASNSELKPLRSVMTPGQFRAGRTRLIEWHEPLASPLPSHAVQMQLPRASAVRSRQKLGAFSRRVSQVHRVRQLSKPSLPSAKRRRRARSCP